MEKKFAGLNIFEGITSKEKIHEIYLKGINIDSTSFPTDINRVYRYPNEP